MKFLEEYDRTGRIPMFKVEDEIELLSKLPDSKPSKRIIKTKKGMESIALLKHIEKNKNHSWYQEIHERGMKALDSYAIFYRGNRFTYREVFEKVDSLSKAMLDAGVKPGDEIPCCLANTPELIYIMLAASKIGARLNLFGSNYNKEYIGKILDQSSHKLLFVTDNYYGDIKDVIESKSFDNKILISLADSLPKDPTKCSEYVPELDSYYHYENKAIKYKNENGELGLFGDFLEKGKNSSREDYTHDGKLDDIFTITYTSGSTRNGFPKAMYHANRSYIVGGIFNTSKLTNTPTIEGVRTLAHIHSDSNTDLITAISDTLMKTAEVAMEPEYSKESSLDVMIMNNPVLYAGTTSHLVEAGKQYLLGHRFNTPNNKRKLGRQLVTIAVGEKKSMGEEKFINLFLRTAGAGSAVEVKMDNGFKLKIPYGPVSYGGGDTEHGGLFYTLQLLFKRIRYAYKGKNFDYGMDTVPFAVVTALKKNENGEYVECDYNEKGIIVANSITNMVGYKFPSEETKRKIIRDNLGRDWITCDVFGYVNEFGNPIFLGREEDVVTLDDGRAYPLYAIDDIICKDSKNVLSCSSIVARENDLVVANVELSPIKRKSDEAVLQSIRERCKKMLPQSLYNKLYLRLIDNAESYPLTGSGKRSYTALAAMSLDDIKRMDELGKQRKKGITYTLKRQ